MVPDSAADGPDCAWTERELELLSITLQLLREHGYDRLSVEAVANKARASKGTMYKRWPSKAQLVLAAFIEGTRSASDPPNTGSLRGDLLEVGHLSRREATEHTQTIRAVINEMSHNSVLETALREQLIARRKTVIDRVLADAVTRGEIRSSEINDEIYDLIPGYLLFRALLSERPPTDETVRTLVDDVVLPMLIGSPTG